MAYKLSYQVQVSWVGPGAGPMQAANAPQLPGATGTGQTKEFSASPTSTNPLPVSNTFTASDITNLLTSMTNDLSTQMNVAATIAQIQNWSTGTV